MNEEGMTGFFNALMVGIPECCPKISPKSQSNQKASHSLSLREYLTKKFPRYAHGGARSGLLL